MSWVATAVAVAGTVYSASQSGKAAGAAADAQAASSEAAIAEQQRQYDTSRADLEPWRRQGGAAVEKLGDYLGLNSPQYNLTKYGSGVPVDVYETIAKQYGDQAPQVMQALKGAALNGKQGVNGLRVDTADTNDVQRILGGFNAPGGAGQGEGLRKFTVGDFYADPVTQLGLQFGLDEGRKGLTRMAAARGSLNSGATLKGLERFGSDYAGSKAADSYNRFVSDQTNIYNRLAGVAGTGQTAANTTASLGSNTANSVGNILTAQGNARGAAGIAQANAYGGAANTIGNYYQQQKTLDRLFPQATPTSNFSYTGYGAGGDYQYG